MRELAILVLTLALAGFFARVGFGPDSPALLFFWGCAVLACLVAEDRR